MNSDHAAVITEGAVRGTHPCLHQQLRIPPSVANQSLINRRVGQTCRFYNSLHNMLHLFDPCVNVCCPLASPPVPISWSCSTYKIARRLRCFSSSDDSNHQRLGGSPVVLPYVCQVASLYLRLGSFLTTAGTNKYIMGAKLFKLFFFKKGTKTINIG